MNGIHWKLERPTVRYGSDLAGPLHWLCLAAHNRKQGRVQFMALGAAGGGADQQSGECHTRFLCQNQVLIVCMT
jgi:hypothetical protein